MEMLNQSISTPVQQQPNTSGTDMNSIGSYLNQQQPSQISGPHQRPSNGSNNLEQHAMIPATTGGDPSNRVFNDQKSSINGQLLQSSSFQMPHQSMMDTQQQQNPQSTQMVSYNLVPQSTSGGRLPPLTLNGSSYSSSSTVLMNNGSDCQMQANFGQTSVQQPMQQQMHQYDQNTHNQNGMCSSMPISEQMYSAHHEMDPPLRMNTPVTMQHVNYQQQNGQSQPLDQSHYHTQSVMGVNKHPNSSSNQTMSMNSSQFHSGHQGGNQMISSFQVNQTPEQVSHLGHMDQAPPPTQHSMNLVPQSVPQQHQLGQMACNSNQIVVHQQNQSPTMMSNLSMNSNSISSTPTSTSSNNIPMINQTSLPINHNSNNQISMVIVPNGLEQSKEETIANATPAERNEMLIMQEPRLKHYDGLKDMSTIELRAECKKRKLSSTGTKSRLLERLSMFEKEICDERNHLMLQEYTKLQKMYEAQTATLKAFQAQKALQQVQKSKGIVRSNLKALAAVMESSSTEEPPAKKRRVTKPKKSAQPRTQKVTAVPTASISGPQNVPVDNNNQVLNTSVETGSIPANADALLGRNNDQSSSSMNFGNTMTQSAQQMQQTPPAQNSLNMFGNVTQQTGTGFFIKDDSCFSHLGSGCRLISHSSTEDSQMQLGGTGRAFQATVPPPPPESQQMQFQQQNNQQMYGMNEQISQHSQEALSETPPQNQCQPQSVAQSRPISLNQQKVLGAPMNQGNAFNQIPTPISMQQHIQQQQQQQNMVQQPNQPSFVAAPLSGLQSSPCVADQAGPSPNMPVSDPTATTSASPVVVGAAAENVDAAELMDQETMQKLLSPATLRAREELLTQQQAKINELVTLIQKNHDTLREQQQQINLAKKQQKERQKLNSQSTTCVLDKHVNSRSIQHAIKSRQNFQILTELTSQQDSIRTAETRLIEQLHINTATDDIARLIKQDGRTALVIVSLLHDYRTTREQNHRVRTTTLPSETGNEDKTDGVEVVTAAPTTAAAAPSPAPIKKKAPARKRAATGIAKPRKAPQRKRQEEVEIVHVIPDSNDEDCDEFMDFSHPDGLQTRTSDVNMEEIFKTVIDAASRAPSDEKLPEYQPQTPSVDNEIISLPSELSSPLRTQSENSAQSVFSEISYNKTLMYQQDSSPQQYTMGTETESSCSPTDVFISPNEILQQQVRDIPAQKPENMESLPHFEQSTLDQELGSHHYAEGMMYSVAPNNDFSNFANTNALDFDFPDIDQMVANFKDSEPLNASLDDVDLTALLNCWSESSDAEQQQTTVQNNHMNSSHNNVMFNSSCSTEAGQLDGDMNWNNYSTQSNIINQAFEQSEI